MARYAKIATLALPGAPVHLDEPDMNRKIADYLTRGIERVLPDKPDLIVLPEHCDKPICKSSLDYYQHQYTEVLERMCNIARENKTYIAFATLLKPDDYYRNAIVMIDRKGEVMGSYHKMVPVIGEMEKGIRAGKAPVVFECDFGRVGCAICFDLCFHEVARAYRPLEVDVMVFSSAYHGGLVQKTWAYETLSHFVNASMGAPSGIISPVGMQLAVSTNYNPYVVANVNLDCCVTFLGLNHGKLIKAKEKYGEALRIDDPGYLGAVLFSSESKDFTAKDVAEEFGIELVRDYFDRVRRVREDNLED